MNINTNSNSGSRASNSGGGTSTSTSNGNSNSTSNSNNNGDGNIVVGAKVVDPIANSKRLSTIVLGAVMLMSPVIVVGNFIWLLSDSFTIIGLPIQKHLGQDVWTICDSKRYVMITGGICNNNNVNSISSLSSSSSSSSSNECMRWGNIDEDKWQVINDNNIYFERYDYDIVKEVRTLWPYIEATSILSTIISISNFIFILPLADFNNRIFYLDAQKILLLLSSLACLADVIVISYILYLSQYSKVLESITWTEQVCRYRVQQSFGLFLLLVALFFSILSVLVCLYSHYRLFIFNSIEIINLDCVAPLPPDASDTIKERDPYRYDDLLVTVTDRDPTLRMLPESATKEKLKKILKDNIDSDDSDSDDEFYKHVKFQVYQPNKTNKSPSSSSSP